MNWQMNLTKLLTINCKITCVICKVNGSICGFMVRKPVMKNYTAKRVNSYNKSLIVKCYNDSKTKRGTRKFPKEITWVDLIEVLSGSQTQCTRRDLDNLVGSISDNIYKSGETAVENPLEVQSEAIRSWAMKLTEPQEDD